MKTTLLILMSAFCTSQIHAYPLPKQLTKSYDCKECSSLSHDKLQDQWSITDQPLHDEVNNRQKSYSYREKVTAKQLKDGVVISTLAPGAVIRITPLQKKAMPRLMLKTPKEQLVPLKEASALFNQDEGTREETLFMKHQTMLQIKPELGAGKFTLKSDDIDGKSSDTYLINVFDKFSLTYLLVESDSLHYQYGDKLTATVSLKDSEEDYSVDDVNVSLVSPQGEITPLTLTKIKHNKFQGSTFLNSEINDQGKNWYIDANVNTTLDQKVIRRSGHAAFSYAIPSASLLSIKKLSATHLTFTATIDVATASRYALQSVLFYQTGEGAAIRPIEISQKAQWFEPGKHVIQFTFDNSSQLSEDNLYLGYLHLIDYGQLKTVYHYNKPIKVTQLLE
ncbi:DUF4785 domain-containing protein [Legionella fallonii]|uniref:DUF4785 domain-containing protein n=1 Tax=Legionella fallonii LLAP-10 TaxID=1212491 RepID=A0A098G5R6_9GAMM|nr:DUF4785 domain-containing protein [Legionella fallonii]CEG57316.1 conserved exported protein of unknown function [Legionella fallonii LLAP-10]